MTFKGSLRSYLIKKGWINSLQSYIGNEISDLQQFDVSVDLTPEGLLHQKDVIKAIFGYILLLQQGELPDYILEEVSQLTKISFEYAERSDPSSTTSSIVEHMAQYANPCDYLTGPRVLRDLNKKEVEKYVR